MSTKLPIVISNGTAFKKVPVQLLLNSGSEAQHGLPRNADSQPARPRTGIPRTCGQCGEIKTSLQWREGPNGAACLCNACGLFFRKLILRFGRAAAKRYMEQIKGTGTKRRIPKELTGTVRF
ncbi:BLD_1a_G0027360.mRNA.1.CDS.1 [Saccharomyces cerevisiae]|nr:BLD_1a_G0027360.mRNA.1.CDS.1 [Saccharomyces cerevisiae]CAI7094007.1 BLD_1a_G0027360.mRNA.1.CDS.1 [Saccharomyces cerevisiae]